MLQLPRLRRRYFLHGVQARPDGLDGGAKVPVRRSGEGGRSG